MHGIHCSTIAILEASHAAGLLPTVQVPSEGLRFPYLQERAGCLTKTWTRAPTPMNTLAFPLELSQANRLVLLRSPQRAPVFGRQENLLV